jgi:predicted dehydrogenase
MLNIAIIGVGIIGKSHLNAIQNIENCRLCALCDLNEEKVKQLAEEYEVPYFLDYREIPKKVKCDAVILNLPHHLHAPASIFFLEQDCHVLVEKPMANTIKECDEMIAAAKRSGKKLAVAHIQRYFEANRILKSIVDSGELGRYVGCCEQRSVNYFSDSRPRWFLDKRLSGGGIVMNYGAHALDKLKYITGAHITDVASVFGNFANEYNVEGHAQFLAKLDNDTGMTVTFSAYTPVVYENIYYFTKGAIRIFNGSTLEICRNGKWERTEIRSDGKEIEREIVDFIRYVKDEPSTIPTPEYGREIIAAIEQIYVK